MGKAASNSRPGRAGARRRPAFTLIELLVVIAIISLLVGILVPVVSMAVRKGEDARCRARVAELASGCMAYHTEHLRYPGQEYPDLLAGNTAGGYTGSQWLSRTLFTDMGLAAADPNQIYPQPKYAPVRPQDDLIDPMKLDQISIGGQLRLFGFHTISDRTSRPLPILYFPARAGISGMDQYLYEDNAAHMPSGQDLKNEFLAFIRDTRFGAVRPYGDKAFVIIAAGMDRVYFTGDDPRDPAWQT